MALALFIGAVAYQYAGADGTFVMIGSLAGVNVALVTVLWQLSRGLAGSVPQAKTSRRA